MGVKIRVTDLWKTFPTPKGPLPVLAAVDFTVAEGEFVALVGPSGCGKTTLVHILAGFERPDRGDVRVDDRPIQGPSRQGIYVFQRDAVFPWLTVQQNMTLVLRALPPAERQRLTEHAAAAPPERPDVRRREAYHGLDMSRRMAEGSASGGKGDCGRRGGWISNVQMG